MNQFIYSFSGFALAATFCAGEARAVISIDFVTIGSPGNAGDTRAMQGGGPSGFGAVSQSFQMARNETSISQYAAFLNAVAGDDVYKLYNPDMALAAVSGIQRSGSAGSFTYSVTSGSADKPITFVSWFDAARFCNWLHNGCPVGAAALGSTEDGAYTLNGAVSGTGVSRNVGATVWIPSENEWYKAAYYDPAMNAGAGGYWLYPTRSNSVSGNTVGDPGALNFDDGDLVGFPGQALTAGGAYGVQSQSAYGTNDQGGNVFEWNDAVIGAGRGIRGGAWDDVEDSLGADSRLDFDPTGESHNVGFRIASGLNVSIVPEPNVFIQITGLVGVILLLRRRW